MIRDAGFVLEAPDGSILEGDPLSEMPESLPNPSFVAAKK